VKETLKIPELSQNAAAAFADRWKGVTEEKQYSDSFWADFFRTLCGVEDEIVAGIERQKRVKSSISGNQEYIDVYWKNVALIEHKSAGLNLDKAELQARGYWLSLPPGYRPKTIIISDFKTFRLIDVALNRTHEFPLSKLPENIHRFEAIISGNRTRISQEEITVDQEAARLMANLYLELESHGFEGHETSVFLIRLLFLLFGDDTGMWDKNNFLKLVMGTAEDGSDVGPKLDTLFEVLNTSEEMRAQGLSSEFKLFPYVNGGIFAEKISIIDFNKKMRVALVDVANYDWTTINPTIFGSLFQLIKNKEARRELGEHYTSEENINKIVYPLFLDELQERLASAWDNKKELKKLRQDLSKIKIFDPACGCGNFLVVSYRHLRQLELELIVRLNNLEGNQDSMQLDGSMGLSITLNQFYGIEIEEWPAQVARMALFLTDHQENLRLERITGATPNRFPIVNYANIVNENALRIEWQDLFKPDENTYILGNPPFIGTTLQSSSQKEDTNRIWGSDAGAGVLDYVSNWLMLAARVSKQYGTACAFVSTNSITQGEQPPIIWSALYPLGIRIDFAHRTFSWDNDSTGKAAVHCVIIGFSHRQTKENKKLFTYSDPKSEPELTEVQNINAYLFPGPDVLVTSRRKPLKETTQIMEKGNIPTDGGYLSNISETEADEIRKNDPIASKYLHRLIGAHELIHNEVRFCLWLVSCTPEELRKSKELSSRVKEVRKLREASPKKATQKDANRSWEFQEIRQPLQDYLAVPSHSSELRAYVPIARFSPDVICNNALLIINDASLATFAFLSSSAFNLWNKAVSGRLESRTRISGNITYNNFPFPTLEIQEKEKLESAAQDILNARLIFPEASLADLYDDSTMPKVLRDAHKAVDVLVMTLFGVNKNASSEDLLAHLFAEYEKQALDTTLFSK
jgi:hypothetical protein